MRPVMVSGCFYSVLTSQKEVPWMKPPSISPSRCQSSPRSVIPYFSLPTILESYFCGLRINLRISGCDCSQQSIYSLLVCMQKVKLSLFTPWVAYRGNKGIAPLILNVSIRLGTMDNFTPLLLYPLGKNPLHPLDNGLGGPQNRCATL
jgi:hypothetical protein